MLSSNVFLHGLRNEALDKLTELIAHRAHQLAQIVDSWHLDFDARRMYVDDSAYKMQVIELVRYIVLSWDPDSDVPTSMSSGSLLSRHCNCISRSSLDLRRDEIWVKDRQELWGLSHIATSIWRACEVPRTISELMALTTENSLSITYTDVENAISDMESAGFLKRN